MNSSISAHVFDQSISSDLAEARRIQAEIENVLQRASFAERDIFAIKLAVEEALVNAIKHGNNMDRTKRVHVNCRICSERFEVQITDEGPGFDPTHVPDPTAPENLERPCGRGLLLMRHYMTEVAYHNSGRAVRMAKIRNGG
jgi:serine/threonine-protein kinase RsbW